ncbi:hypothetical protein ABW21_db0204612 [Orbilia brochopaga]|nr:hypothetical protein ABW21_db0204612 [Drechslerella brochopaga]
MPRYILFIRANEDSESGKMPPQEAIEAMTKYWKDLVAAGVLVYGDGTLSMMACVHIAFRPANRSRQCAALEALGAEASFEGPGHEPNKLLFGKPFGKPCGFAPGLDLETGIGSDTRVRAGCLFRTAFLHHAWLPDAYAFASSPPTR